MMFSPFAIHTRGTVVGNRVLETYKDQTAITWTGDRSAGSRIDRLKKQTLQNIKTTYSTNGQKKNEKETNSRIDALARVRGGGAVAPPKKNHSPHHINAPPPTVARYYSTCMIPYLVDPTV